jgi:peptidyl-prolyl cis-trans isomerase A (cyclophilin A)
MRRAVNILLAVGIAGAGASVQAKPYAVFKTTEGEFVVELWPEKAPKTVENFVGLAKGTKTWQHPGTKEVMKNKPLYDGTVFHRTIKDFMIQGGDPLGKGTGDAGYKFEDEFSDLKFDQPGYLAMANSGPNTNGCQFFVTVKPTPFLTNKHTIFGKVVKGMDVVLAISNMPSGPNGQVTTPVTLTSVTIVDALPAAGAAKPADAKPAEAKPAAEEKK